MMNLGGPSSLDKVYDFLCRLFSDREIIKLPFQKLAGPILARRRTPHIQEQYAQIGGGSPIRKWTEAQGEAMCKRLDEISPSTAPHKHYIAFRYAEPLSEQTVAQLKRDGVSRAVAFTQYPQYSCTTTGSSLNELYRQIEANKDGSQQITWSVIDRWSGSELLAKAFAKLIKEELEHWPVEKRSKVVLVFSAHSIPHMVVDRGDPYPAEVANTMHCIMKELGHSNPARLVWQSKVGPLPWLGPKTYESLEGLASHGDKDAILIPIAFTSDHIETLFELDMTYMKDAREKLGMEIRRCKALNTEPLFIEALAQIALSHLKSQTTSTTQYPVRCPGCTNEDCLKSRQFYLSQTL
jgi:ferrochelatase